RMDVPDILDVPIHGAADFDARGVDKDELGKEAVVLGGHFQRQPSAERKADRRQFLDIQALQQIEIDVADVVRRLDPVRPFRPAETGRRGNDQLVISGKLGGDRRVELERILPIEHQQRTPPPAPFDLELHSAHARSRLEFLLETSVAGGRVEVRSFIRATSSRSIEQQAVPSGGLSPERSWRKLYFIERFRRAAVEGSTPAPGKAAKTYRRGPRTRKCIAAWDRRASCDGRRAPDVARDNPWLSR